MLNMYKHDQGVAAIPPPHSPQAIVGGSSLGRTKWWGWGVQLPFEVFGDLQSNCSIFSGCEFQGYTWVFKGRPKCNRCLDHALILFAIY